MNTLDRTTLREPLFGITRGLTRNQRFALAIFCPIQGLFVLALAALIRRGKDRR